MATSTIEKANILTPEGNVTVQLSGEDGHFTICVTAKDGGAFFDNVVLVKATRPDPQQPVKEVEMCKISEVTMKPRWEDSQ